jgi:hypothetical protein
VRSSSERFTITRSCNGRIFIQFLLMSYAYVVEKNC